MVNFEITEETEDFVVLDTKGGLNITDVQWLYDMMGFIYIESRFDGKVLCRREDRPESP